MPGVGTGDAGDWFGQGFRLAYFLVPERGLAIRALADAVNRLNARCRQESKRAYWRDKYLKRGGSKISRADADTLQWLIYFAAEKYEKELERRGEVSTGDLIIRYIKNLIQTSTAMSSFYVGIGLHRLLHNYSTAEVQRMYELMTERYLGADEYRRAKRLLMNKLSDRFGELLSTATAAHGETRFAACEDQDSWVELVRECLLTFVPWSTRGNCLLPANGGGVPDLLSGRNTTLSLDAIEMNRCHAMIDPTCFARLTEMLRLDSPEKRLALPKFKSGADHHDNSMSGSRDAAGLTESERAAIEAQLNAESGRRRGVSSNVVRILVDGVEEARVNPLEQSDLRNSLRLGAKMIELWTSDAKGELLLGTQLLSYANGEVQPCTTRVEVGGAKLELVVSAGGNGEDAAMLRVTCMPAEEVTVAMWLRTVQYAALALVLVGAGWILGVESSGRTLRAQRAQIETMGHAAGSAVATLHVTGSLAVVTQRLAPYESSTRGGGEAIDSAKVRIGADTMVVHLELSVAPKGSRKLVAVLKRFPERTLILSEELTPENVEATDVARLSLPANLLTTDKAYLVDLTSAGAHGRQESVGTYMFQVVGENR